MLRIQPQGQKNHKAELLPIAPEFGEMLLSTPESQRQGFVFNPGSRRPSRGRLGIYAVSTTITRIGRQAGVKVAESPKGKVKHASAHDLRRAFGTRWADRVMPAILQQLMRHADISTTMTYYVGKNAESAAEILWNAVSGHTLGHKAASGDVLRTNDASEASI
jgi:integrase